MFYEKWVAQLDAKLSAILADYDPRRHRCLRIVLRPVRWYDNEAQEIALVDNEDSRSPKFKTTLLKAMISKIAVYNPGSYDIVKISWG
jgi:hypothetical protein